MSEAGGASSPATVSIAVASTNDLPTATADAYATNEDTPLTVSAPGVLANDTDVDGDPLSAVLVSGPSHGTLSLQADGAFTYTPAADFFGADAFTYTVNDGGGASSPRPCRSRSPRRTICPTATADTYATNEDTPLTVSAPGVLANDTDVDGDALSAVLVSGPSHGTLSLQGRWRVHLHAGRRLLRRRCVHLHGQRWRRRLEPRDRVDRGRLDERRADRRPPTPTRRTRTRR